MKGLALDEAYKGYRDSLKDLEMGFKVAVVLYGINTIISGIGNHLGDHYFTFAETTISLVNAIIFLLSIVSTFVVVARKRILYLLSYIGNYSILSALFFPIDFLRESIILSLIAMGVGIIIGALFLLKLNI